MPVQEARKLSPAAPRGLALLQDPTLNMGTAFTEPQRDALGLRGLLPPHVMSQDEQVTRVLINLRKLTDPLEKFVALNSLHDRNEALFFRVLCDNIDEMQPLVYTPTVGLACQRFGHIFQRPRGIFISANDRGRVEQVLRNWPYPAELMRAYPIGPAVGNFKNDAPGLLDPIGNNALAPLPA